MQIGVKVIAVFIFALVTWLPSPVIQPAMSSVLGQVLPSEQSATYTVQRGDTLVAIAGRLGTTVNDLVQSNGLKDPNLLYPGEQLIIPGKAKQDSVPGAVSTAPSVTELKAVSAAAAMTEREQAMFNAVNQQRAAAGLGQLVYEPSLLPIARARSNDMATRNYFSHTTPEGGTVQDLVKEAGLHFGWSSEILARNNYPDDQSVSVAISAFMKSDSHRAHILYAPYTRAASGEVRAPNGIRYYTVMLATD
jgi:uncharacterized protein YkwD